MSFWKNLKFPTRKGMKRGQRAKLSIRDDLAMPEGVWSTYDGMRIETWRPEPDEVIILRPKWSDSINYRLMVINELQENFPENRVIMIPEEMELRRMSNEALMKYFMNICELIIKIGKEPYASRFTDGNDD